MNAHSGHPTEPLTGFMWVVMRVQPFEFESFSGIAIDASVVSNMRGYLPVYISQEEAMNDFPDGPIVPVKIED